MKKLRGKKLVILVSLLVVFLIIFFAIITAVNIAARLDIIIVFLLITQKSHAELYTSPSKKRKRRVANP